MRHWLAWHWYRLRRKLGIIPPPAPRRTITVECKGGPMDGEIVTIGASCTALNVPRLIGEFRPETGDRPRFGLYRYVLRDGALVPDYAPSQEEM